MRCPPLVAAVRPAQALKQLPVLAPVAFGHRLHDPVAVGSVVACAVAFTLVASGGYLVNDVVDRADDATHPRKRARPVAAGTLSPRTALVAAGVLVAAGLAVAVLGSTAAAAAAVGAYLAATLAYSLGAKRVVALGPAVVALGFVLRVLGGAWAAPVTPSGWLVGLTAGLASALAVAKRENDARRRDGEAPRALRRATDALLLLVAAGYAAYTLAPGTVALHGTRALAFTVVPVAGALARFRARLRADRTGAGPADLVVTDPVALALGAAWAAACLALLA
ncbi:MAG: UbiA family prenyltransferase [Planctomycetota bacterium]